MAAKLAGQGGGKYDLGNNSEINVTPFVDILLVLLIIFMVAVPMATVSIKLDLPPATPPSDAHPKPPKVLSIQASGDIFIDQQKTDFSRLVADVAAALGGANPRGDTVYIRADKAVRYAEFMQVLNTLQDGGFSFADVVRCHYYVTDAAFADRVFPILGETFGTIRPAATMVVCDLIRPEMLIEIEVTALRGS